VQTQEQIFILLQQWPLLTWARLYSTPLSPFYCGHRSNGPHLCEDVRLYPDTNLKYLTNPNWSDDTSWREHVYLCTLLPLLQQWHPLTWARLYYIIIPYQHFIYCKHRNDGPHLCEDVRLYPDGNLETSVCLLPSFLIYVLLKRLIIDGASIIMSILSTLHREQPNSVSPCSNSLFWSYLHIYKFPKFKFNFKFYYIKHEQLI
jgi:hypothetical protein